MTDWASLEAKIAPLDLRSCLIYNGNRLVVEHYRHEGAATKRAKINSCTKSVLSALICIAMQERILPGHDTPASDFFPQLARDSDPRKKAITIGHLLTMSAGFAWTEFGGANSFPRMTRTADWIGFALEQPLSDDPGTRMTYNSGVSQLLSAMLAEASGMSVAAFAERKLFGPLGIAQYEWEQDPSGLHTGGFGLRLLPADLLKLGRVFLQGGEWNGLRLIDRGLAALSVAPAIDAIAPRTGRYAWHWWTNVHRDNAGMDHAGQDNARQADEGSFAYYYALGFGGQYVIVVPEKDTVVVLTNDKTKREKPPLDVFGRLIAPVLSRQR